MNSRGRDYPPLVIAAMAMLLLLAFLPSALNLPQSNPSQTLEYAPVPPEDDSDVTPPAGNLSSLGLASSGGGLDGNLESPVDDASAGVGGRAVKVAGTKRCVGTPPRQTEDPGSPPCVASYSGDNGGSTYAGVSKEEVRVVIYMAGGFVRPSSRGSEQAPVDRCFDLGVPPEGEEDLQVRFNRTLQRYFNDRYQTYGRFVRFIHCFDGPSHRSPEGRRSAAAEHVMRWKPFAFLNMAAGQGGIAGGDYSQVMFRRGVLGFGTLLAQPSESFRKFAGLSWGYLPSAEVYADQYADFVCRKLVGHLVSYSGIAEDLGKPRRFGLLYTDNPGYPELIAFARLVKSRVTECGGEIVADGRYPEPYTTGPQQERVTAAQANMVTFQDAGVTTILWPGGWEMDNARAAKAVGYFPEWLSAGDGEIEGYDAGQLQDQDVWRYAWVVANQTLEGNFEDSRCYQALREADPEYPRIDAEYACPLRKPYESFRQLFIGIQVAGPGLRPESVDKGFHAIPAVRSDDPRVPACYYEVGDYTCVKDVAAAWWDPNGTSRNNRRGCWKMVQGARRYLKGGWTAGDIVGLKDPAADRCNGFAASILGS